MASTQSLKNKDIPEGGAKGTILPSCVHIIIFSGLTFIMYQTQRRSEGLLRKICRRKLWTRHSWSISDQLLQAMIDLLIPGRTPGVKGEIVDLYNTPELLFFGPDGRCMGISAHILVFTSPGHCRGYSGYDGLGSLCVSISGIISRFFDPKGYL